MLKLSLMWIHFFLLFSSKAAYFKYLWFKVFDLSQGSSWHCCNGSLFDGRQLILWRLRSHFVDEIYFVALLINNTWLLWFGDFLIQSGARRVNSFLKQLFYLFLVDGQQLFHAFNFAQLFLYLTVVFVEFHFFRFSWGNGPDSKVHGCLGLHTRLLAAKHTVFEEDGDGAFYCWASVHFLFPFRSLKDTSCTFFLLFYFWFL